MRLDGDGVRVCSVRPVSIFGSSPARGISSICAAPWCKECLSGFSCHRTSPICRASDKGFLSLTVQQYLELLDWTGRQVRGGAGQIPDHLASILERLGIVVERWAATITSLDGWFPRVMGRAAAVTQAAADAGRRWFRGVGRCRTAFAS
jgi:hypothetical protein